MRAHWERAFLVASLASLLLTTIVRRIAYARGFVDRPAQKKFHRRPTAYLGGVAVTTSVLLGMLLSGARGPLVSVAAVGASALCILGLLDDARSLPPLARLAAQATVATAAALVGARLHISGYRWFDVMVTVVFVSGIVNACNLLDNIDGLLTGYVMVAATGVAVAAVLGGQYTLAVLATSVAGACLGFIAWNWRPATIFLGDAGSLALGFLVTMSVLELRPVPFPPGTLIVVLLLTALPLTDTATVVLGRWRHDRSLLQGGTDHLSHRIVALGASRQAAVAWLLAFQAALAVVAILGARGVLGVPEAAILGILAVAVLLISIRHAHVYHEPAVGLPRSVRVAMCAVAGLAGLAAVASVVTTLRVRGDLEAARSSATQGFAAARRGDAATAAIDFDKARQLFGAVSHNVSGPLGSVAQAVPVVGENLRTVRVVAAVGRELTDEGARLSDQTANSDLAVHDGIVPVAAVRRLTPEFRRAGDIADRAARRIAALSPCLLHPQVRRALATLQRDLRRAASDAQRNADAAGFVPKIFGADGPRRYFLAVQNNAELRGTGGMIGNWGTLTARDGRLTLEEFQRISTLNSGGASPANRVLATPAEFGARYDRFGLKSTWQNINMAADFPSVGRVVHDLLPQSGGPAVDGVITVDPPGLAALLRLTGPVSVDGWPNPITADTVVDVTLRDAYAQLGTEARVDFLGRVARAVWSSVTHSRLGNAANIAQVLSGATRQGHMAVWFADPSEEGLAMRLGIGGGLRPARADSLMLVNQNAAGNKTDYYLHRSLDATVTLRPEVDGRSAKLEERVSVQLRNDAPGSGLSETVIGPFMPGLAAGENRTYLSVYTPLAFRSATLDGTPTGLQSERELGYRVYSSFIGVPAKSTRTLRLDLAGSVRLGPGGWYALDLGHQAVLNPDHMRVRVEVPRGWRIAETRGLDRNGSRDASRTNQADGPSTVWVRVAPAAGGVTPGEAGAYPAGARSELQLSARSVRGGRTVAVSAPGFAPGTAVAIDLGTTPAALVTASPSGRVDALIVVPSVAHRGATTVTLTGVGDDGRANLRSGSIAIGSASVPSEIGAGSSLPASVAWPYLALLVLILGTTAIVGFAVRPSTTVVTRRRSLTTVAGQ